jgi:hypothetical protein
METEIVSCNNCAVEDPHCTPKQQKEWCLRKKLDKVLGKSPAQEIRDLEALVEIQGEILAAMSREGASSPEILEIQCGLSAERGKNLNKLWHMKGEI